MSKSDATQASSDVNYQDDVNVNLNCEHDLDATTTEYEVENEAIGTEPTDLVKAAVQKVFFIDNDCCSFLIGIYFSFKELFTQFGRLLSIEKVGPDKFRPQILRMAHRNQILYLSLMLKPTGRQLTKCFVGLLTHMYDFLLIYSQVMCLTIMRLLTPSHTFTKTSGHSHCQQKSGRLLNLLLPG